MRTGVPFGMGVVLGVWAMAGMQAVASGTVDDAFLLRFVQAKGAKIGDPRYDPALDLYADGKIDSQDLLLMAAAYRQPVPTPVAPDTPTATPTFTPIPGISIADYFPLTLNSSWSFADVDTGPSDPDAFTWTIAASPDAAQRTIRGETVTIIKTTTAEPSDDRNLDEDWWAYDLDNTLFYYGFRNGQADNFRITTPFGTINGVIPVQDIVLNKKLRVGEAGMTPGQQINDTSSVVVQVLINNAPQQLSGTATSTITIVGIQRSVETRLGTFTNVLHIRFRVRGTFSVSGFTQNFDFRNSEFFLAQGIGLVVQDQDPDPNDALLQVLTGGMIGGVPIIAQ